MVTALTNDGARSRVRFDDRRTDVVSTTNRTRTNVETARRPTTAVAADPAAATPTTARRPDARSAVDARRIAAHDVGAAQLRTRLDGALATKGVAKVDAPPPPADAEIAYAVKDHALELSANGAGAAELQSETLRTSIELYKEKYPTLSNADIMDRAMATTAMVLDGPGVIEHLEKLGGNQQVVEYMKQLPADTFAGMDLDSTAGSDLKPAFSDGTPNQAFHSNFFVTAGYINPDSWLAKAGNLKHELFDAGATVADYKASHEGLETGATLRAMRDAAAANPDRFDYVAAAPAVVNGIYANDPTAHASYDIAGTHYDFTTAAQQASDYATQRVGDLDREPAVWMVGLFQGIRGFLGLPQ